MSRPRFLVDHDFNQDIIDGAARREPGIEFTLCREVGLNQRPDSEVLGYAAAHGLILLSHDVNTMTEAARSRIAAGKVMSGLLLAHQFKPVVLIIESLLIIWAASEAEEYVNQILYLPI
jgi:hypothetical protein